MRITDRDLKILERVRDLRACDSRSLDDLFPTPQALRQRLWRLVGNAYLIVHRAGNDRIYSLGRAGVRVLGLQAVEIRIAPATAARYVTWSRARRLLLSEGFLLEGEMPFGRTRVLRARRDGREIAIAICGLQSSIRAVQSLVHRLLA